MATDDPPDNVVEIEAARNREYAARDDSRPVFFGKSVFQILKEDYDRRMAAATRFDYPEDFHLENGNYRNICWTCRKIFSGSKYRRVCRECYVHGWKWWYRVRLWAKKNFKNLRRPE